jgi:hypothetical protein
MLGETLAQAELDILATSVLKRDEMMAQYNLLGDPLLRLDAAPPRLTARAGGSEIGEGAELVPPVGERSIDLGLDLIDETGIARLDIVDSEGRDYEPLLQLGDDLDPRARTASIELPVHAQGYTVDLELYDGAYPQTRPTKLSLQVPFDLEVRIDGKVVEEGTGSFAVGAVVPVEVEFTSPISLTESEIELSMDGALVRSLEKRQLDADARQWEISYIAEGIESDSQAIRLLLAGDETVFTLSPQGEVALRIEQHYPFPNPTPGDVRFVVRATRGIQWARLNVYDLQGRQIVDLQPASRGSTDFSFEWDGRDRHGDELANGVYFYRIEISDGNVTTRSDMGRVVVMR